MVIFMLLHLGNFNLYNKIDDDETDGSDDDDDKIPAFVFALFHVTNTYMILTGNTHGTQQVE